MTHSASRWQDVLKALQQPSEDPSVNQALTDLLIACKRNDPDATKNLHSSVSLCLMAVLNHLNSNISELSDLSAKFVAFVLYTPVFARLLSASEASLVLSNVCELCIGGTRKATVVLSLWILSSQVLEPSILIASSKNLCDAIAYGLSAPFQSGNAQQEAANALNKLISRIPQAVADRAEQWLAPAMRAMVVDIPSIREHMRSSFKSILPLLCPPNDQIVALAVSLVKSDILPAMDRLAKVGKYDDMLFAWEVTVTLLGPRLLKGGFINDILRFTQHSFLHEDPAIRVSSFRAWKKLVDNMAAFAQPIIEPKKIMLLMTPIATCFKKEEKSDANVRLAAIGTWCHILTVIGCNVAQVTDTVIAPILPCCISSSDESVFNTGMAILEIFLGCRTSSSPEFASQMASSEIQLPSLQLSLDLSLYPTLVSTITSCIGQVLATRKHVKRCADLFASSVSNLTSSAFDLSLQRRTYFKDKCRELGSKAGSSSESATFFSETLGRLPHEIVFHRDISSHPLAALNQTKHSAFESIVCGFISQYFKDFSTAIPEPVRKLLKCIRASPDLSKVSSSLSLCLNRMVEHHEVADLGHFSTACMRTWTHVCHILVEDADERCSSSNVGASPARYKSLYNNIKDTISFPCVVASTLDKHGLHFSSKDCIHECLREWSSLFGVLCASANERQAHPLSGLNALVESYLPWWGEKWDSCVPRASKSVGSDIVPRMLSIAISDSSHSRVTSSMKHTPVRSKLVSSRPCIECICNVSYNLLATACSSEDMGIAFVPHASSVLDSLCKILVKLSSYFVDDIFPIVDSFLTKCFTIDVLKKSSSLGSLNTGIGKVAAILFSLVGTPGKISQQHLFSIQNTLEISLQCSDEQLLSKASLFWNSFVINNHSVDIPQSLIKAAKKANKNGAHVSLTQQIWDSQTMDSASSLPDPSRPFYMQSPGLLLQSSPIRDKEKGRERLKQENELPRNPRSTPQQAVVAKKRPQFVNEESREGYVTIEPKKLSGVFTQHQKEVRMQQAGAAAHLGLAVDLDEDVSNTMEYIDNALLNENTQPDHSQSAPDSFQPTRVPSVPKVQPSSVLTTAPAPALVSYQKPANRIAHTTASSPRNVAISPAISSYQSRIGTPVASEAVAMFRSPSPAQLQNPQQSPVVLELGINTEDLNLTPRGQSPSEEGLGSKGILKRTGSANSPDSVSLQASRDRKRVRWSPDAKALFINMGASGEGSSTGTSNGKGLFSGDDFMRPDLCNCSATVESLGIPFGPPIKCVLASQGIDTIGKLSTISSSLAKNIFQGDLLRRVTAALKAYKPVSSPTTVSSSTFRAASADSHI